MVINQCHIKEELMKPLQVVFHGGPQQYSWPPVDSQKIRPLSISDQKISPLARQCFHQSEERLQTKNKKCGFGSVCVSSRERNFKNTLLLLINQRETFWSWVKPQPRKFGEWSQIIRSPLFLINIIVMIIIFLSNSFIHFFPPLPSAELTVVIINN